MTTTFVSLSGQTRGARSPLLAGVITMLALLWAPAVAFSQIDVLQRWPDAAVALERAALDEDVKTLRVVRDACVQALAGTPPAERAQMLRYAIAYANWRMAYNPLVPEAEQEQGLSSGVTVLEAALKVNDRWADAHGLLGTIYGVQIGKSPFTGMTLGPRAGRAMARAAGLEPDNPRVAVQQGIGKFHTPAMFGGSLTEAEAHFRRALDLLAKEPMGKPWPNWGRFDAHVWLGQVLAKRKDAAGARAEYERALVLAPRSRWVRDLLLPQVQSSSATRQP